MERERQDTASMRRKERAARARGGRRGFCWGGGYAGLGGRGAYADGWRVCRAGWERDGERMLGDGKRMMMERFCWTYHEIHVASIISRPSSRTSLPPTSSSSGQARRILGNIRLGAGGAGDDLLDKLGQLAHDVDAVDAGAQGKGQAAGGALCCAM